MNYCDRCGVPTHAFTRCDVCANFMKERRERIATAALQGILGNSEILRTHGLNASGAAGDAVEFADALIAALDAEPGKGEK